jgi:hypothetical protein
MTRKHDYAVGYARPPQHTRFQKGKCPNRKGRPRRGASFKDERERVLQEPITITKNGRPVRVSAREAMLLRLRGLALEGNLRAMEMLMRLELANENTPAAGDTDKRMTRRNRPISRSKALRKSRKRGWLR